MKIICTGGAGFIGGHLVDRLIKEGNEVSIIDDFSGGSVNNLNNKIKNSYFADCRDEEQMDKIFKEVKPEIVYHLAANAAENKAQFSPIDITSRNYDAFIKTLTPFIKYGGKRFIFTSSIAVYGEGQTPFKEADEPKPEDLYGISKLAIESSLEVMSRVHGFEYVITRPHNVYGPRQNKKDPYRNVVAIWMNAIMKNEPFYIYGDGTHKRCFSYIDDVIDALYNCLVVKSGSIFNIGADKAYSLIELSNAILGASDSNIKPIFLPERPQEVHEAISDHTCAKKYLNYQDKTSLEDGIKKTWEWASSVGYEEPIKTGFEIMSDKIPSNWL